MRRRDLEGVAPADAHALASLACGETIGAEQATRLHARGWIDIYARVHLITLAGRHVIDAFDHRAEINLAAG